MRGYFSSQISDNMSKTPEGYLLCHDVKVARTGWQTYSGEEWGDPSKAVVKVWRGPDEVFSDDTMQSGAGKTITYNHPPQWVGPQNESAYSRGTTLNIRRDPTPDADGTEYMLADLLIKDAQLISMVENNQTREVSLGYTFVPGKTASGHAAQKRIIINHTAVVPKGRAGSTVAIRDSAGKVTRKPMKIFDHLIGLGLVEYGKTASPEELAAASRALITTQTRRAFDAAPEDDDDDKAKKDKEAKDARAAKDAKAKDAKAKDDDEAPGISEKLDQLIQLLTPKASADAADPEIVLDPDEIPVNPIPGADAKGKDAKDDDDKDKDKGDKKGEDAANRKIALDALLRVKPIIAATGDQKAIDAFNAQVREIKGTASGARQATDAYRDLAKGGKKPDMSNGMRTATDAARVNVEFEASAKKYHRKSLVQ